MAVNFIFLTDNVSRFCCFNSLIRSNASFARLTPLINVFIDRMESTFATTNWESSIARHIFHRESLKEKRLISRMVSSISLLVLIVVRSLFGDNFPSKETILIDNKAPCDCPRVFNIHPIKVKLKKRKGVIIFLILSMMQSPVTKSKMLTVADQ